MSEAGDDKKAAEACFESVGLDPEKYRTGNTKACVNAQSYLLNPLKKVYTPYFYKLFFYFIKFGRKPLFKYWNDTEAHPLPQKFRWPL